MRFAAWAYMILAIAEELIGREPCPAYMVLTMAYSLGSE